jgi:hypothetical protein
LSLRTLQFILDLQETETPNLCEHLGSPLSFGGSRVVHLFSFLCCDFCFVCLRAVSCVSNVASICGLSIIKYHLRFSLIFIATVLYILKTFHNLAISILFLFFLNINLCVVTKHFTKDSHLTGKHQVALYEYVLTC